MKQIILIAIFSIKKAIRDKTILAMLLLFVPFLIGLHLFSFHSFGFQIKFIKDISLSYLSLLAGIMLLFLASEQIFWFGKEKTPYHILTRIKNRFHIISGICLGISSTIAVSMLLAVSIMLLILKFTKGIWFWEFYPSALLISLKFLIMTSIITFFGSFLSKSSALSLGILTFITGHINSSLFLSIQDAFGNFLAEIYKVISVIVPDFTIFGIQEVMVHDYRISAIAFISMVLYSLFTSIFYLILSTLIINRHDL